MTIEAMKQALEALEYLQGIVDTERGPKAAEALRQAIAEAEKQEREWVGLTDEETQTCWDKAVNTIAPQYSIVRAIEAKLKQKNGYEEKNT